MPHSGALDDAPSVSGARSDGLRFDVFLSHNSTDKPLVERIAERLKRERLDPWLDAWHLVPGEDWQQGLAEALRASRTCAVFVGPTDLGAWENHEVGVALDRAANDPEFRLFLVLLPGLPEPFDAATLSPFLRRYTWVDYRGGLDDERAFHTLVCAIKGLPVGPAVPIEAGSDVCPYRGLDVFEEKHAEFFFGRDGDVQRLLEELKSSRFLAVLGASGSGKSSLVRAGLLPALRRGAPSGEERWEIVTLRPGAHPLEALGAQLVRLGGGALQETLDGLGRDVRTLHLAVSLAVAERPPATKLLLFVDQFEEVFTLCRDEHERTAFFANLLYAATIPGGATVVLPAMRADFYHRCGAYPELAQQVSRAQYLVSSLQLDGLRQAVEEPARRVGLAFEPGLVATILDDVAERPGALPLLEHALFELWQRRAAGLLTLAGYRDSGGVKGAIAKRADEVFSSLKPGQQEYARQTFLRLTQPGEGTEDTRRRAPLSELDDGREDVNTVLDQLVRARLVVTSRDVSGGEVVEVAHEALIRGWPRLRAWIDEDRAGFRVHRRLTEAALDWEGLGREDGALYRGAPLATAREWAERSDDELNALEREFLAASTKLEHDELEAARRRARRFRILSGVLAGLLLLAAVAGGYAFLQKRSADQQRQIARSRALAAQARVNANGRLDVAALLAVQAWNTSHTIEARDALTTAVQRVDQIEGFLRARDRIDVGPLTFADGGRTLLVLGFNRITQWDVRQRRELPRPLPAGDTSNLAYSPRQDLVAQEDENGGLSLWALRPQKKLWSANADADVMAFSPDGRTLAIGGYQGEVTTISTSDPRHPHVFRSGKESKLGNVVSVGFTPDGKTLVAIRTDEIGGTYALVTEWKVASGKPVRSDIRLPVVPLSLSFSPTGDRAVFNAGRQLGVLSTKDWRVQWQHENGKAGIDNDALRFSPDGQTLAILQSDGTIALRRAGDGGLITTLKGNRDAGAISFSPDGRTLAASGGEAVTLWHVAVRSLSRSLVAGRLPATESSNILGPSWVRLSFSPGTATLAQADARGSQVWRDVGRQTPPATYSATYDSEGDGVALSRRGLLAVSGSSKVSLVDVRSSHGIRTLSSGDAVGFSDDGRKLAVASDYGALQLFDVAAEPPRSGRKVRASHQVIWSVALSPDGRRLAAAGYGQPVTMFDVNGLALSAGRSLPGDPGAIMSVAFSGDGKLVAAGGNYGRVRLWDSGTGKPFGEPIGAYGPVQSVAFSRDSSMIAAATQDGNVRLWDIRSHRTLGDPIAGYAVAFSGDGKYLATATPGAPTIWPTALWQDPQGLVARLCAVASRNLTPGEWREFSSGSWHKTCSRWPR